MGRSLSWRLPCDSNYNTPSASRNGRTDGCRLPLRRSVAGHVTGHTRPPNPPEFGVAPAAEAGLGRVWLEPDQTWPGLGLTKPGQTRPFGTPVWGRLGAP